MIRKIGRQFEEIRVRKHHCFDDFDPIIRRCLRGYAHLFPNQRINMVGSKVVYHFNVEGVNPISLEKEHGSREFVPRYYAKLAMIGIEDVLSFIEANAGAETGPEEVEDNEQQGNSN